MDELNSPDLYFNHVPGEVVRTNWVRDKGCGMFPCFWMDAGDCIKVSTSVVSLIKDSGRFDENPDFNPVYHKVHPFNWPNLSTIDKRITRLGAFEARCRTADYRDFCPQNKRVGRRHFIDESLHHLIRWVNKVERMFPNRKHVMCMGGRDSRLVWLVPKEIPKNWCIFSSQPNTPLVVDWLERNGLHVPKVHSHTNENDDGDEYLLKKLVATDCLVNPQHLRWARKMVEIAEMYDNDVVFWLGNAGDTLNACRDNVMCRNNYQDYWKHQYTLTPSLQGGWHRMCFNLTGCPAVSGYSAPDLWDKVYQLFDPAEFHKQDLRCEMGDILAGRALDWTDPNPVPPAWFLDKPVLDGVKGRYLDEIGKILRTG